jgi:hypothetical protein
LARLYRPFGNDNRQHKFPPPSNNNHTANIEAQISKSVMETVTKIGEACTVQRSYRMLYSVSAPFYLRGETKGSKIKGKMGVKWDSRDGLDGHQPTASRCDLSVLFLGK